MKLTTNAVDTEWMVREGEKTLRLVERLTSHEIFLQQARARKAEQGASLAFEHETILQTQEAERDARVFFGNSMRLAKHFKNAGMFDEGIDSWKQKLKENGPMTLKYLWGETIKQVEFLQVLQTSGISKATIEEIGKQLAETDVTANVKDNRIILRSSRTKRETVLAKLPKLKSAKTVGDLLFANRFDDVAAQFLQTDSAVPVLVFSQANEGDIKVMNPLDAMLVVSTFGMQEFTRRKRELEDVGLTTEQGGWLVPVLIGISIALVVASVVIGIQCKKDGKDLADCPLGVLGFALAMLALYFAGGEIIIGGEDGEIDISVRKTFLVGAADIAALQSTVQGDL